MYPLVLFIIAVTSAIIHLLVRRGRLTSGRIIEVLLGYIIPLNIGLGGLIGFTGHAFYGNQVAQMIGWPANNPFQSEIAAANLAIGVAGIVSIWWRQGFWLATTLISGIFIIGAAWVHFTQIAIGDYAPYNSGVFLYIGDIGVPIVYLVLSFFYGASHDFFRVPNKRR